jgi:SAM-dependent methyltransferase
MSVTIYSNQFYEHQGVGAASSASSVVPLIMTLGQPTSVFDLGCGRGHWLRAFRDAGVAQVHGLDGPWVDPSALAIAPDEFTPFDFGVSQTPPKLPLDRYDLATSFEVLEHLDEAAGARAISFLVSLSDLIVVGAAAPGQGGSGHLNERWPAYWYEQFVAHGYECFDIIRPQIWDDDVEWWYAQNTLVYAKGARADSLRSYAQDVARDSLSGRPRGLIHPGLFDKRMQEFREIERPSLDRAWEILKALLYQSYCRTLRPLLRGRR